MASPYTSARSGLWDASDVDTWGQGIGVYPQTAADLVTIAPGHTVTYNKSSTAELGVMSVYGTLKASRTMNTKITFGHVECNIYSGGEWDWGKTGDTVGASYVAEVIWNTTVDASKGFVVYAGGKLYTLDNTAYYGALGNSFLQANWTSGTTFYVTDNVVGKWAAGHELTVHKKPAVYGAISDVALVSIASTPTWDGAKSTIVINEAFPTGTFNAGGRVENVSRNVQLSKYGAVKTMGNYNTLRPRVSVNNTEAAPNAELGGCWTGWYYVAPSWATTSGVIRNGENAGRFSVGGTISAKVYSCNQPLSNCYGMTLSGELYSNSTTVYVSSGTTFSGIGYAAAAIIGYSGVSYVTGAMFNNSTAIMSSSPVYITGEVYGNGTAFNESTVFMSGRMGYNGATNIINTVDQRVSSVFLRNTGTQPIIAHYTRNTPGYPGNFYISDYNGTVDAYYRLAQFADIYKNTVTVRTGGQASSIEVIPLSLMTSTWKERIPGFHDWVETNVPASYQVRNIFVKGEGWSGNFPTNTTLYLEAEYMNGAGGTYTTTTVRSTQVLTDNTTWTSLSVAFTPGQTGTVKYRIWFGKYAASCKVYVDTALYNLGRPRPCTWRDGEAQLELDYSQWNTVRILGIPV